MRSLESVMTERFAEAVAADTVVGKVLATGSRAAGDTHAGGYAIVNINF